MATRDEGPSGPAAATHRPSVGGPTQTSRSMWASEAQATGGDSSALTVRASERLPYNVRDEDRG